MAKYRTVRTDGMSRRMSESDRPQAIDIVTRLRQTRADMIGTDDEPHYFDCHEAAAEIERLRRWKTLTDAEREAIGLSIPAMQYAADELGLSSAEYDGHAATLRGLLERTK